MPLTILVVLVGWLIPPSAAGSLPTPPPAWRQAVPRWFGHPMPASLAGETVRAVEDREDDDDDRGRDHGITGVIPSHTTRPSLNSPPTRGLHRLRWPTADRSPILRC